MARSSNNDHKARLAAWGECSNDETLPYDRCTYSSTERMAQRPFGNREHRLRFDDSENRKSFDSPSWNLTVFVCVLNLRQHRRPYVICVRLVELLRRLGARGVLRK